MDITQLYKDFNNHVCCMTDDEVKDSIKNAIKNSSDELPDMRPKIVEYLYETIIPEIDRLETKIENEPNNENISWYIARFGALSEVKNDLQSLLDELIA